MPTNSWKLFSIITLYQQINYKFTKLEGDVGKQVLSFTGANLLKEVYAIQDFKMTAPQNN